MENDTRTFLERIYEEYKELLARNVSPFIEPDVMPMAHEEVIGKMSLAAKTLAYMAKENDRICNEKSNELGAYIKKSLNSPHTKKFEEEVMAHSQKLSAEIEVLKARNKAFEELYWTQMHEDHPKVNDLGYPHIGIRKGFLVVRWKDFNENKN